LERWNEFTKEGIIYIGSGKDPNGWVCPVCGGSGEKWRVWLYEFMEYDDNLRQKILDWASALEVEKFALDNWMINLERDGVFKMIKWLISPNELYRLVKHK
jgi:type II secretory ATPase GspE/PulE/Tfp pilus assembly ATPase PilB-like protein